MTTNARTEISISQLQSELAGEVIGPDDPGYDDARKAFMPFYDERRPAVIIRPKDAREVGYVVSLARESGLALSVRSGGHSGAGHSTSDGGILLDLSLMKGLEIDPAKRVAWAETGLTAAEVTNATAAHGLVVGFGDTGSVGIGGLTTGGGVGYLVRKHGLTIDDVLAAEIVLADGRILQADEQQNSDLFWAIRGGGGNFGVVTRFKFRLHPVDTVTGGMLVLPATVETITGFMKAAADAPEELSTIANVMTAPPMPFLPEEVHGEVVILAMLVHAGSPEDGERAIAPFRALATPHADMVREMPYPEIYPPDDPEYRPVAAARTMFVDGIGEREAELILERLRSSTAMMAACQLRALGGAMARVPNDATAFAHRQSEIMVNVAAIYGSPDEASVHEDWVTEFASALRQSDDGMYVNFVGDEGEASVRASYPGDTWNRLAAVKRRYDPNNLFRMNQNIPPGAEEAA